MSVTRYENKTKVASISPNVDDILNAIYPIGVIVCGAKPTVGTWEKVEGRFLLGSSSSHPVNQTGGEENHTLTVNEMPSHTHTLNRDINAWDGSKVGYDFNYGHGTGAPVGAGSNILNNTGSSASHNNMPPYLSVDMWRRTA